MEPGYRCWQTHTTLYCTLDVSIKYPGKHKVAICLCLPQICYRTQACNMHPCQAYRWCGCRYWATIVSHVLARLFKEQNSIFITNDHPQLDSSQHQTTFPIPGSVPDQAVLLLLPPPASAGLTTGSRRLWWQEYQARSLTVTFSFWQAPQNLPV